MFGRKERIIRDLRQALAASRVYNLGAVEVLERQLAIQARLMNRCAERLEDEGSATAFDVALALREAARRYDQ